MTNQSFDAISVKELGEIFETESADRYQLVDVREPAEIEIAALPDFQVLSLSQFPQWSEQIHQYLDADKTTLVLCHHGIRSAQMCQWLVSQGFTQVKNITGGIDAYSLLVDRSVPRY
jgi:rhodanese-related sulfurtransferase